MELASKYDPKEVESKWYQYWLENKLFSSKPDGREPYTIVIPPPNVTGVLHMGHMLNNTIQDILVRRARMEGKNACWVPGTDHASIATEAKVVNKLAQQGVRKTDLTRDDFLKHAWDWTNEHGVKFGDAKGTDEKAYGNSIELLSKDKNLGNPNLKLENEDGSMPAR